MEGLQKIEENDKVIVPKDKYYIVELNNQGEFLNNHREKIFIIPVNSVVKFQMDYGQLKPYKNIKLVVNKPFKQPDGSLQYTITPPFQSQNQYELTGSQLEQKYLEIIEPSNNEGLLMLEFSVLFSESGSFFIQIQSELEQGLKQYHYTAPQYINVEPVIQIKDDDDKKIKCNQIKILTVISKCLGTVAKWPDHFDGITELGYNAIHFTPLQVRGTSQNPYSIADQNQISEEFFGKLNSQLNSQQKHDIIKKFMQDLRQNNGVLSVVDIVLNHTAQSSEWILEHPSATYNTNTCPHLYSAWLLDEAISEFSNDFMQGQIQDLKAFSPHIKSEEELQLVMKSLSKRVLTPLKIHEFFMCDPKLIVNEQLVYSFQDEKLVQEIKKQFEQQDWFSKDHFQLLKDELTYGYGTGPDRFNVKLKIPEGPIYFLAVNNEDQDAASKEIENLLIRLNQEMETQVSEYMLEAEQNIEKHIRFWRIFMKKQLVSEKVPLVDRYFSQLKNEQKSKVANNGYIIGQWDVMQDFAMSGWHYLRRSIKIWPDNIKLRYGKCPQDSPYLWSHMKKYVESMAGIFDGFRLENAHSTPIHVCEYMLQAARCKNKNLLVIAELFTNSAELDALFAKRLNINLMIRELQNENNTFQLSSYFKYTNNCGDSNDLKFIIDNTFKDSNGQYYEKLLPKRPEDLIYDCTHDNPSVYDKYGTGKMALPLIGLNCLQSKAIGSTWGYDLLIKEQIHCLDEKRKYSIQSSIKKQQKSIEEKNGLMNKQFDYTFELECLEAEKVVVVGEFNDWKNDEFVLKQESNGIWKGMRSLLINKDKDFYQYKFVIDGKQWVINETQPKYTDQLGNINNLVLIPGKIHKKQLIQSDLRETRILFNQIHDECNQFNCETAADIINEDIILITRQFQIGHTKEYDQYVSIQKFEFKENKNEQTQKVCSIALQGQISEVVFAGYLNIPKEAYNDEGLDDEEFIYRPRGCQLFVFKEIQNKFCNVEKVKDSNGNHISDILHFHNMPSCFTCVLKVKQNDLTRKSSLDLIQAIDQANLSQIMKQFPQTGLNHILYRCEQEEKEISNGKRGPYGLQNYGQFPYGGIASVIHILQNQKKFGKSIIFDEFKELAENIQAGDWLIDYTLQRLESYQINETDMNFEDLIIFLKKCIDLIKQFQSNIKFKYVVLLFECLYYAVKQEILQSRCTLIKQSEDPFLEKLVLSIYQFYGRVPSAFFTNHKDTVCAGLPHFSTGFVRCWGRDTFISLKGLFIATGLEKEAKSAILYFASVMRHGLIPNLHDSGNNTRYNARDATWFFLQAIKDYTLTSKEGDNFLKTNIDQFFLDDDQKVHLKMKSNKDWKGKTLTILELIVEILDKHAKGIEFREWNAGRQIDEQMVDEGFNIKITCDIERTGFCFGGNQNNCGTWMDKNGSSEIAGNKGKPATPRDGAPIELVALQYSILKWLQELNNNGILKQKSIKINDVIEISYQEWSDKIKNNFETKFWIPLSESEDKNYEIDSNWVHRRGIYKDVYKSSYGYTDYQLRPNVCIAMSYAPELFKLENAIQCLETVSNILMEQGCIGIKTLDPNDYNYKGDYVGSDESNGWNYHQGPEWVWPVGYFLKALIQFKKYQSKQQVLFNIMQWLKPHKDYILSNDNKYEGLPELTSSHGSKCIDSCATQAWSVSTIIEVISLIQKL